MNENKGVDINNILLTIEKQNKSINELINLTNDNVRLIVKQSELILDSKKYRRFKFICVCATLAIILLSGYGMYFLSVSN